MTKLHDDLARAVGTAHVLRGTDAMGPYLTDWRGRYTGDALAVVRPATTAEVAAVVLACARAGVAMVPQGGNTGLCGGATPLVGGSSVLISLARMNHVRAVDTANDVIVAESGCTLAAIQQVAAEHDRLFPLSLASEGSCQIGGNLSTNAGGVHVLRYGNMREQVLGLEVVLPDGTVWDGLRALRKDNTGYDLKQLFVGAEGTLGIITAAVLKLYARPRARTVIWAAVRDPAAAVALLEFLRTRCGDRVSAFELIGNSALELVLRHIPGSRSPFPDSHEWAVLIELSDVTNDVSLGRAVEKVVSDGFEAGLIADAVIAASGAQIEALWALRENVSEAQRIEGVSIKHDISVPVSQIPRFLACARERLSERWPQVRIVAFGHIGDGNLHYNLSKPDALANREFMACSPEANRIVHDLVGELGGSISAEHGLGQLKRLENTRYKSSVELDLMRRVKAALDPRGLMNPGKVL